MTGGRLSWALLKRSFITGVCFAASIVFGFMSFRETSIVNATLIPALQPALILLGGEPSVRRAAHSHRAGLRRTGTAGAVVVVLGASSDGSSVYGDLLAFGNLLGSRGTSCSRSTIATRTSTRGRGSRSVFFVAAPCVTPWRLATSNDLGGTVGIDWLWLVLLVLGPGGRWPWPHDMGARAP